VWAFVETALWFRCCGNKRSASEPRRRPRSSSHTRAWWPKPNGASRATEPKAIALQAPGRGRDDVRFNHGQRLEKRGPVFDTAPTMAAPFFGRQPITEAYARGLAVPLRWFISSLNRSRGRRCTGVTWRMHHEGRAPNQQRRELRCAVRLGAPAPWRPRLCDPTRFTGAEGVGPHYWSGGWGARRRRPAESDDRCLLEGRPAIFPPTHRPLRRRLINLHLSCGDATLFLVGRVHRRAWSS